MNQCERCLKHTDGIHTCTPSEFARNLERERDRYRNALVNINHLPCAPVFDGRDEIPAIIQEALK